MELLRAAVLEGAARGVDLRERHGKPVRGEESRVSDFQSERV